MYLKDIFPKEIKNEILYYMDNFIVFKNDKYTITKFQNICKYAQEVFLKRTNERIYNAIKDAIIKNQNVT